MTNSKMTASEIGILWSQYIQNSMSMQITRYFVEIVEDEEIKNVLDQTLSFIEKVKLEIERLFNEEQIPIPAGFSESDVNLTAPKLYTDPFMLSFIEMFSKSGTLAYSVSLGGCTRKDIRSFFTNTVHDLTELFNMAVEIGLLKGSYTSPPTITPPSEVEYVNGKSYFTNGLNPFNKRTLNSVEIFHLFENLKANILGSQFCTSFAQTTDNKQIQSFFIDGKNIGTKHVKVFSDKLIQSEIQPPTSHDHGITESTTRVFSDKLMMFLKSVLTSTSQGNYSTASTASMRYDLVADYQRLAIEVALYAKDGLDIMLKNHWLEEPPQATNRKELLNKN